jgi:hypothetical protein
MIRKGLLDSFLMNIINKSIFFSKKKGDMHILQLEQMVWMRVKVSGGFPAEPRASFSYGLSGKKVKNIFEAPAI